jgi:hypothetical protein
MDMVPVVSGRANAASAQSLGSFYWRIPRGHPGRPGPTPEVQGPSLVELRGWTMSRPSSSVWSDALTA